jgi:hypothetical protein
VILHVPQYAEILDLYVRTQQRALALVAAPAWNGYRNHPDLTEGPAQVLPDAARAAALEYRDPQALNFYKRLGIAVDAASSSGEADLGRRAAQALARHLPPAESIPSSAAPAARRAKLAAPSTCSP